jgi:Protein of unknown function (DUF2934)
MAKRTPRSSAEDSGAAAAPPKPRARRERATPSPNADTATVNARTEGGENNDANVASEAGDDAPLEAMSMGSEPSEEDIRMRAYQRFLERGGGHGSDFEDWLEAERELKRHRS